MAMTTSSSISVNRFDRVLDFIALTGGGLIRRGIVMSRLHLLIIYTLRKICSPAAPASLGTVYRSHHSDLDEIAKFVWHYRRFLVGGSGGRARG
jgi:hypothetical protein